MVYLWRIHLLNNVVGMKKMQVLLEWMWCCEEVAKGVALKKMIVKW